MPDTTFAFATDSRFTPLLLLAGVTPGRSRVVVDDTHVRAQFGPYRLETARTNVVSASVTGPYQWWRGVGIRVSLADRGLTFGSSVRGGTCLQLREPVSLRIGRVTIPLKHPGLTVTVAEPEALAALVSPASAPPAV